MHRRLFSSNKLSVRLWLSIVNQLLKSFLFIQVLLTRFPSFRDVALARQVKELTNQRVKFDVNPEHLNPKP